MELHLSCTNPSKYGCPQDVSLGTSTVLFKFKRAQPLLHCQTASGCGGHYKPTLANKGAGKQLFTDDFPESGNPEWASMELIDKAAHINILAGSGF